LSGRRALALRDALVVALVVGLAVSITLSGHRWLSSPCGWCGTPRSHHVPDVVAAAGPGAWFSAWSILTAALSSTPLESLRATRRSAARDVWIVFGVLDDASAARRSRPGCCGPSQASPSSRMRAGST